jgi:hypothetical protein
MPPELLAVPGLQPALLKLLRRQLQRGSGVDLLGLGRLQGAGLLQALQEAWGRGQAVEVITGGWLGWLAARDQGWCPGAACMHALQSAWMASSCWHPRWGLPAWPVGAGSMAGAVRHAQPSLSCRAAAYPTSAAISAALQIPTTLGWQAADES